MRAPLTISPWHPERRISASSWRAVSLLIVLASLCPARTLLAQDATGARTMPNQAPRQRVVTMPEFKLLDATAGEDRAEAQQGSQSSAHSYLMDKNDLIEPLSRGSAARRITRRERYAESLELARGMRDLGLERYRELEPAEAIEYLERARNAYERAGHDLISPQEVSEVLFYLALSHLELGDGGTTALGILRQMILMDPSRQIKEGYFPENVVNAYDVALRGLIQEIERRGLPLELDDVARRLATLTDSDQVLIGFMVPSSTRGGYLARLFAWSPATGKVEWSEEHEFDDITQAAEVFSRMTARWVDCIKPARRDGDGNNTQGGGGSGNGSSGIVVEPGSRRGEWSVDLTAIYGTYLIFPRLREGLGTPSPGQIAHFGNYGVGLSGQYRLRPELAAYTKLSFMVSQSEHSGLIDARDVTALRASAGAAFSLKRGRFRPELQLGLEVAHVSDFAILGELGCAPRPKSGECSPELSSQRYEAHDFMLGAGLGVLLGFQLNSRVDLITSTATSYYLYSTADRSEEINLPWSGELGVRYRF